MYWYKETNPYRYKYRINCTDSAPTKPMFVSESMISDLLDHGQIIFGNLINIALTKAKKLWKYDFNVLKVTNTGFVQNLGHINIILQL